MARATKGKDKGRAGRKPAAPAFVVPARMNHATKRKVQQLIDAQLEEIGGKPRTPHLHRFRFQLVPMIWLAGTMAGLASYYLHTFLLTAITSVIAVIAAVVATRDRTVKVRKHVQGAAVWAACWSVAFALIGPGWWGGLWEAGWAATAGLWAERYRWKGPGPMAGLPGPGEVEVAWRELCAEQKWFATLGPPVRLAGGAGERYPIICNGRKTPIGKIISAPDAIAAAYDGTLTTVVVEPREDGVRSRGWLTILKSNTLMEPRHWDGTGLDPETGLAVVGRFPEGGDAHERYFQRGVGGGARHTIVGGADGSGKTGKLDQGLCISTASGLFMSVILDPQMGQALPAWQDQLPYACGIEDCMAYLRGLYVAMMARSEYLAGVRWVHPRTGKVRKGMGFFDPFIKIAGEDGMRRPLGLPYIEIVIDEAPILLSVKGAAELITNIAKLGRKVGFRLVLAAQVPSLAELKAAELRSILVGGNVFGFRAGDKVSGGMLNLQGKPHELPKYFPNREPTRGLCYCDTIEGRGSVPMRSDWIEEERLYDFAETATYRSDGDVADLIAGSLGAEAVRAHELASAADDAAAKQLRVLGVLTTAMGAADLIAGCDGMRVSEVADAVDALEADGKIRRSKDGKLERV